MFYNAFFCFILNSHNFATYYYSLHPSIPWSVFYVMIPREIHSPCLSHTFSNEPNAFYAFVFVFLRSQTLCGDRLDVMWKNSDVFVLQIFYSLSEKVSMIVEKVKLRDPHEKFELLLLFLVSSLFSIYLFIHSSSFFESRMRLRLGLFI